MKKRNRLTGDSLKVLFEPSADGSYFRFNRGNAHIVIEIPTPVMHRLYRLGQAYGMRQLRYFDSEVRIIVGTVELPEFAADLKRLTTLVNDPEVHDCVERLIGALDTPPGAAVSSVAVVCGDYFDGAASNKPIERTR